jgi:hypothetical protein
MRERRAVACVDGPLAGYAPGFRVWLTERGYRPASVEGQAFLMGHLSRWLTDAGLQPSAFSGDMGHEQERTTHVYLHADLALKQRTPDRITPPSGHPGRYRAPDSVIAFLDNL